jgi:hypothetical protein
MYWTRDILYFFGIKSEDINIFLNIHQVYKFSLTKQATLRSFSANYNVVNDRTGSYWVGGNAAEGANNRSYLNEDDLTGTFQNQSKAYVDLGEDSRSFHVNIGQF